MPICPQCNIRLEMHEPVCRRCGFDMSEARLRPPPDEARGGRGRDDAGPSPFARRMIDFVGLVGQTLVVIAALANVGFIAALVKRDRHAIAFWCGGLILAILAAMWIVFDRLRVSWRERG